MVLRCFQRHCADSTNYKHTLKEWFTWNAHSPVQYLYTLHDLEKYSFSKKSGQQQKTTVSVQHLNEIVSSTYI